MTAPHEVSKEGIECFNCCDLHGRNDSLNNRTNPCSHSVVEFEVLDISCAK